jgi:hypothetical protein
MDATDKMGRHFHPASASRKEITGSIARINRKKRQEGQSRHKKA